MRNVEIGEGFISFEILGEPASKANSRRLVPGKTNTGKRYTKSIKSDKALNYLKTFDAQCPELKEPIKENVRLSLTIYYASRRPDLDGSLIEDALQGKIIANDRQIHEKNYIKKLDKENPRTILKVEVL